MLTGGEDKEGKVSKCMPSIWQSVWNHKITEAREHGILTSSSNSLWSGHMSKRQRVMRGCCFTASESPVLGSDAPLAHPPLTRKQSNLPPRVHPPSKLLLPKTLKFSAQKTLNLNPGHTCTSFPGPVPQRQYHQCEHGDVVRTQIRELGCPHTYKKTDLGSGQRREATIG